MAWRSPCSEVLSKDLCITFPAPGLVAFFSRKAAILAWQAWSAATASDEASSNCLATASRKLASKRSLASLSLPLVLAWLLTERPAAARSSSALVSRWFATCSRRFALSSISLKRLVAMRARVVSSLALATTDIISDCGSAPEAMALTIDAVGRRGCGPRRNCRKNSSSGCPPVGGACSPVRNGPSEVCANADAWHEPPDVCANFDTFLPPTTS
mmetsp:Transcript_28319/g.82027  ORF Transcript_28319/g.82027 Transcript_28319/m.82027 type:complete len:214 (+) Transcript_28319:5186-5827(+)